MMESRNLPENTRHIHLAGIGGVGVSALAPPLLRLGYTVSGSDPVRSEITERLKQMGIRIYHTHQAENIEGASLVAASSAIPPDNPELLAARAKGIPVWRRAELLAYLLERYRSIVVTGAHGKTTVTAMITHVLLECDFDPTAFIGGDLPSIDGNVRMGDGEWAVAEGDESDGSFLLFHPDIAIVNNIDEDHLDFYDGIDAITNQFRKFLQGVRDNGWIVISADCERAHSLIHDGISNCRTYGFAENADTRGGNYIPSQRGCLFSVFLRGQSVGEIVLRVCGKANAHNALAAVCVSDLLGIPFAQAAESLNRFQGVKRRMEEKGIANGVCVVDDYAHHPEEIRAVVSALKERYPGRLIGVFQPHLFSRTLKLKDAFGRAFTGLDTLILTDIYAAREQPVPGVTGEILLEPVKKSGVDAIYVPYLDDIPDLLQTIVHQGDTIVTIGAGDVWKVGEAFLQNAANSNGEVHVK